MTGANYMGGKRNFAKAKSRDVNGRLERGHFVKQRYQILSKALQVRDGAHEQQPAESPVVPRIDLAHAKGFNGTTDKGSQHPNELRVSSALPPKIGTTIRGPKKPSLILKTLDTNDPVSLQATRRRILSMPDLAGLSNARAKLSEKGRHRPQPSLQNRKESRSSSSSRPGSWREYSSIDSFDDKAHTSLSPIQASPTHTDSFTYRFSEPISSIQEFDLSDSPRATDHERLAGSTTAAYERKSSTQSLLSFLSESPALIEVDNQDPTTSSLPDTDHVMDTSNHESPHQTFERGFLIDNEEADNHEDERMVSFKFEDIQDPWPLVHQILGLDPDLLPLSSVDPLEGLTTSDRSGLGFNQKRKDSHITTDWAKTTHSPETPSPEPPSQLDDPILEFSPRPSSPARVLSFSPTPCPFIDINLTEPGPYGAAGASSSPPQTRQREVHVSGGAQSSPIDVHMTEDKPSLVSPQAVNSSQTSDPVLRNHCVLQLPFNNPTMPSKRILDDGLTLNLRHDEADTFLGPDLFAHCTDDDE